MRSTFHHHLIASHVATDPAPVAIGAPNLRT